jgi:hypothetical protein
MASTESYIERMTRAQERRKDPQLADIHETLRAGEAAIRTAATEEQRAKILNVVGNELRDQVDSYQRMIADAKRAGSSVQEMASHQTAMLIAATEGLAKLKADSALAAGDQAQRDAEIAAQQERVNALHTDLVIKLQAEAAVIAQINELAQERVHQIVDLTQEEILHDKIAADLERQAAALRDVKALQLAPEGAAGARGVGAWGGAGEQGPRGIAGAVQEFAADAGAALREALAGLSTGIAGLQASIAGLVAATGIFTRLGTVLDDLVIAQNDFTASLTAWGETTLGKLSDLAQGQRDQQAVLADQAARIGALEVPSMEAAALDAAGL